MTDDRNARRMVSLEAIARHFAGQVCGDKVLIPTQRHPARDRGTSIKIAVIDAERDPCCEYVGGPND